MDLPTCIADDNSITIRDVQRTQIIGMHHHSWAALPA